MATICRKLGQYLGKYHSIHFSCSSLNKLMGQMDLWSNLIRLFLQPKIHVELIRSTLNHCQFSILSPISLANKQDRMHTSLSTVKLFFYNLCNYRTNILNAQKKIFQEQLHRILPGSKKSHYMTGVTAEAGCNPIQGKTKHPIKKNYATHRAAFEAFIWLA